MTFQGTPCKYGHDGLRYKNNGGCVTCTRLRCSKWSKDNREYAYEYRRKKNTENPEKNLEYWRRYRETHREYLRDISQRSRLRHPETMRAYIARRRLREKATPTDRKAVAHLIKSQRGKCYWCKQKFTNSPHLDHVWPLYLGGSGGAENLVLACQSCNTRKNKKSPIEFAQQLL